MSFWILTDACSDLPCDYIRKQDQFQVVPMLYSADQEEAYLDLTREDCFENTRNFYAKMRGGASTHTGQVNQKTWEEAAEQHLKDGEDVLILAFSSGLSGTAHMAALACEELKQRYPERQIASVDSLGASLGEGLFVHHCLKYRDAGHTFEETRAFGEEIKLRVIHWFTVDDMVYLKRGGRISAASYVAATVLRIKPVLNVDPKGHLVNRAKVQGRRRSLKALLERTREQADRPETQTVFIGHGDCIEDAEWLAGKLREELKVPDIMVSQIGPVIGAHSGPGTLAVFFLGRGAGDRLEAE
ncbi:MAG: DegV family protein [Clostridia bacterium]|nr:DegV family protein [Clostridia bacterium]